MNNIPLVSIIITSRNEEKNIENCLESIQKQSYKNTEIIVVDNNSTDRTKEISKKYTKLIFNKGPERSAQRNYGARKSNGDYFIFLDADMILTPRVIESCVEKILSKKNIVGVIIPEESFGEGFWAQCKRLERSFYVGVEWMEAARFFPKEVFIKMDGYDEKNTGTEDYDLPQRIMQRYGEKSIQRINKYILHNEGILSLSRTLKKKYYYAQNLRTYSSISANRSNFNKQANILHRYLLFLSQPQKLITNHIYSLGMIFMKTSEFVAGGLGYIKGKVKA